MPQEFITEKQKAFPVPLAELLEEGKVADRHGFLEMTDFQLDTRVANEV